MVNMIKCACGCGTDIPEKDNKNRPRKYVIGHTQKGIKRPWAATLLAENRKKHVGEAHWNWQGGTHLNTQGYVMVHSPDHPNKDIRNKVREHRLVMEKHLGRYLEKDEVVHHINGIRNDNRLENLQLLTAKEHDELHKKQKLVTQPTKKCIVCGSSFIVRKGRRAGSWEPKTCCRQCYYVTKQKYFKPKY